MSKFKLIHLLKKSILSYLRKKKFILIKESQYYQNINYYRDLLLNSLYETPKNEDKIDSIVFSKDRAMQLHAFLTSFLDNIVDYGNGKIYVLYKASNEKHRQSYEDLKIMFENKPFVFVEEIDFRKQLLDIISNSNAKLIGFYVDDMIFLQKVSYKDILNISPLNNIVSLSRGKDLYYSVVLQKQLDLPNFDEIGNGMFSFKWNQIKNFSDWTYPLGVGGYFYGREEVNIMFNNIVFKAPNSLESQMQKFIDLFIDRNGICYNNISCCCVHANIVQTECNNPVISSMSVDFLLEEWEKGKMIDLSEYYGKTGDVAQFQIYSFINR